MKITLLLIAAFFAAPASFAAECDLMIDRTPCAGKESEALKPYEGKNPTVEKAPANDAETCLKKAERAAKIIRKGTLTQKTVSAKFEGKDLGKSFTDKAACK